MNLIRHGDAWVWVGGPVPPGSAAITLGRLVIVRRSWARDERLMRHELVHVRQWRELGVAGFLVRYLGTYFGARWQGCGHREAYRRIPLEVEAEREARSGGLWREEPDPTAAPSPALETAPPVG